MKLQSLVHKARLSISQKKISSGTTPENTAVLGFIIIIFLIIAMGFWNVRLFLKTISPQPPTDIDSTKHLISDTDIREAVDLVRAREREFETVVQRIIGGTSTSSTTTIPTQTPGPSPSVSPI